MGIAMGESVAMPMFALLLLGMGLGFFASLAAFLIMGLRDAWHWSGYWKGQYEHMHRDYWALSRECEEATHGAGPDEPPP